MWVAAPTLALGIGLPLLGAWGIGQLASANDWDPDAGWGAAGVWPGALMGASLGVGVALKGDYYDIGDGLPQNQQ